MNDEDFSQDKRWDSLDTDSKQGSIRSEAHAYTVPEVQPYCLHFKSGIPAFFVAVQTNEL